jgi:N-dimethylarginine dimethylaminohydrolase
MSAPSPRTVETAPPQRHMTPRSFLMCRPEFFTVSYSINPWMHPDEPTDTALAVRQWESLRQAYLGLGHEVHLLEPVPEMVDMVFTANGCFTHAGRGYVAKFAHAERTPEAEHFRRWLRDHGFEVHDPSSVNEGEGDFAFVGGMILAGTGYRSAPASHEELERVFGVEVISLTLVDPRFYHLDVALTVLDSASTSGDARIAYLPEAFDERSRAVLADRFPGSILVSEAEAEQLALNSVSDGRNVLVAAGAVGYIAQLERHGYVPVPLDLSELLKSGGGIKCCTQELRR